VEGPEQGGNSYLDAPYLAKGHCVPGVNRAGMSHEDARALQELLSGPPVDPDLLALQQMRAIPPKPINPDQLALQQMRAAMAMPASEDQVALAQMLAAAPRRQVGQPCDEDLRALQQMRLGPPPRRFEPPPPRPAPPPVLPERPKCCSPSKDPPVYMDEGEYPDPAMAERAAKFGAGALIVGMLISVTDVLPATWFVWTFLAVHVCGVLFLTDCSEERSLVAICCVLALHAGVALSEALLWPIGWDGAASVGPWSMVVLFACTLYLHSFWSECNIMPPDCITSISLFFPIFPAFNAAVVFNALEFFLEWRYFPDYKIWISVVVLGLAMMAVGFTLIFKSCRAAGRNYWASIREHPEEEEFQDEWVGLEIPDRRVVQDGTYRWERHPAYLGALMLGIGVELVLCNPVMLILVSFVLWASLLHVSIEEEKELYEEFPTDYGNYCALTSCWIPLFNNLLANAAFTREMSEFAEKVAEEADNEPEEEEEEEDDEEEDEFEEDEDGMLPGWSNVPRGGSLWNRQFREPWRLG